MNEAVEKMLNHSVDYATELLNETGEAYPFGAFLDTIDNVHPLEMEVDPKNMPTIGQVVDGLKTYCEGEIKASKMNGYTLAYEVNIQLEADKEPTDAIAFELHAIDQEDLPQFYLPFAKNEEGKVEIGQLFGVKA